MIRRVLMMIVLLLAPVMVRAEEAIVSFTFDDAPQSVITVGLPILERAGYPATVYIATRNTTFNGYMHWDDIARVAAAGWEVGAHTFTHPHLTKLTDAEIEQELEISNREFLKNGYQPKTFASPFGAYDDRVLAILKRYYQSHRAAWPSGVNTLKPDPYAIISYGITREIKIEEIESVLENLQKTGGWVIFQLHYLTPKGAVVTEEYGTDLLEDIVEQVRSRNIAVLTVSDALLKLNEKEMN